MIFVLPNCFDNYFVGNVVSCFIQMIWWRHINRPLWMSFFVFSLFHTQIKKLICVVSLLMSDNVESIKFISLWFGQKLKLFYCLLYYGTVPEHNVEISLFKSSLKFKSSVFSCHRRNKKHWHWEHFELINNILPAFLLFYLQRTNNEVGDVIGLFWMEK